MARQQKSPPRKPRKKAAGKPTRIPVRPLSGAEVRTTGVRDLWVAVGAALEALDRSGLDLPALRAALTDPGHLAALRPVAVREADVPLHTESESNMHEFWRERQERAKDQNGTLALVLPLKLGRPVSRLAHVTVTRCAKMPLDQQNLDGACKHVVDGIARWLGVDDRDPRVAWGPHRQQPAKQSSVRIRVESWPTPGEDVD
jgi:hypothetical protein